MSENGRRRARAPYVYTVDLNRPGTKAVKSAAGRTTVQAARKTSTKVIFGGSRACRSARGAERLPDQRNSQTN